MKIALMQKYYDHCGICGAIADGRRICWWNPYGDKAHERCVEKIRPCMEAAIKMEGNPFGDPFNRRGKYLVFTEEVQKSCGSSSIVEFLEKDGEDALTRIFVESFALVVKKND